MWGNSLCVFVDMQETISVYVWGWRSCLWTQTRACSPEKLSGNGLSLCVAVNMAVWVSPGSPGCVHSLGFHPLSCTSPPPRPSSCIHLRGVVWREKGRKRGKTQLKEGNKQHDKNTIQASFHTSWSTGSKIISRVSALLYFHCIRSTLPVPIPSI